MRPPIFGGIIMGVSVLSAKASTTNLMDRYSKSSIDDWQAAVLHAAETNDPSFPRFSHLARLGSLNLKSGIEEAFALYRILRPHIEGCVGNSKVYLDFGCGVGRILKAFMRDFAPKDMIGLDVSKEMIDICKADFPTEFQFYNIPARPRCALPDASVDVITSYSVFSHFSAIQATRWLDEFNRILRPGGTMLLTTYGRSHLDYIYGTPFDQLPPNKKIQHADIEAAGGKSEFLRMFGLGEMIYYAKNPNFGLHDYGHAYVGEEFVRRIWGRHFEVIEVIDNYSRLEQMAVVLRKPK